MLQPMRDFDKNFTRMQTFMFVWFIVVGFVSLASVGGLGYLAYYLLTSPAVSKLLGY